MRLSIGHTGTNTHYYVIQSVTRAGKHSSEIIEKLGTAEEIKKKYHCKDAEAWARAYVKELNQKQKDTQTKVLVPLHTHLQICSGQQNSFNVGYLFLQKIYYDLHIPYLCKKIAEKHKFTYDLDSILSRLLYGRILFPSSKRSCYQQAANLLEQPNFELQHVYRALSLLAEESDFLQERLYKNSKKLCTRKTGILYYDCTNYFFETEDEEGLKQYGYSKEHRPSPIVQMGLFMDASGLPLAFCINPGNTSEQLTLKPLEQQILRDFELSRFVVCTDAGLSSAANRMFNNVRERCFVTTQSIKMLKAPLQKWALNPSGWHLQGSDKAYDLNQVEDNEENLNKVFYKQRYMEGYDEEREVSFNQTLIVTFSLKYKKYLRHLRQQQIERAKKFLDHPKDLDKTTQNNCKRFIRKTSVTKDGEVAKKTVYSLNQAAIEREEKFDGFYAVCTNLMDDPMEIIDVNRRRWEIEESFRMMKHEFKARPVFLKRDDRILAHFTTCFIALLLYRLLEQQLERQHGKGAFTCENIVHTLRKMRVTRLGNAGYVPSYTRTDLTDALHDNAGFRTDFQFMTDKTMKGVCRRSKNL